MTLMLKVARRSKNRNHHCKARFQRLLRYNNRNIANDNYEKMYLFYSSHNDLPTWNHKDQGDRFMILVFLVNFQSSGKGSNSSSEQVVNPVFASKDDSLDKKHIQIIVVKVVKVVKLILLL